MCTAIGFNNSYRLFGRTLDLEYHYNEEIVISPRNFPFNFRYLGTCTTHHAFIGVATVAEDYPLYYDGANEKGLSVAGLNFPKSAAYGGFKRGLNNVAVFEFIPYVLSNFATVAEVEEFLQQASFCGDPFSPNLPAATLHWLIFDKRESITVEPTAEGIKVYKNPFGVLTNEPEFPYHSLNITNYMNLTAEEAFNRFSKKVDFNAYSRGMGSFGLPGDNSSASRFVRAVFAKLNSPSNLTRDEAVGQFFHVLGTVNQVKGSVRLRNGAEVYTVYTSCYDTEKMAFYYTTYNNRQISAVNMLKETLDSAILIRYPMRDTEQIKYQN